MKRIDGFHSLCWHIRLKQEVWLAGLILLLNLYFEVKVKHWWQGHYRFREHEAFDVKTCPSVLPVDWAPRESAGVGCAGGAEDAWTLGIPKPNPPKGCWAAVVCVGRPPKPKPVPAVEAPRVTLVVAGWDAAGVLNFGREALDAKTWTEFLNITDLTLHTVHFQLYSGYFQLWMSSHFKSCDSLHTHSILQLKPWHTALTERWTDRKTYHTFLGSRKSLKSIRNTANVRKHKWNSPENENDPMFYSPSSHPGCKWLSSFRRIQSELYKNRAGSSQLYNGTEWVLIMGYFSFLGELSL